MKIKILSCAEQDFAETVDYYNNQRHGLGYEFALEVEKSFNRIKTFPEAWPLFSKRTRRCLTNRFPYGIIYKIRKDCILIGGIMHLKRAPKRWQKRANFLI
jgi:toxin ParE1/3/4